MLIRKRASDTAIVVLHEIYGINRHIHDICNRYGQDGYDVYCPNLIGREPFDYAEQEQAYRHFYDCGGFAHKERIKRVLKRIRPYYTRIILLGFSVGATLAWLCSELNLCDKVICCYGSRIRDYLTVTPIIPVLLLFAQEDSFNVQAVADTLRGEHITTRLYEAGHGFLDPYCESYHQASAELAWQTINRFIEDSSQ